VKVAIVNLGEIVPTTGATLSPRVTPSSRTTAVQPDAFDRFIIATDTPPK
jgi:hypothetical protein